MTYSKIHIHAPFTPVFRWLLAMVMLFCSQTPEQCLKQQNSLSNWEAIFGDNCLQCEALHGWFHMLLSTRDFQNHFSFYGQIYWQPIIIKAIFVLYFSVLIVFYLLKYCFDVSKFGHPICKFARTWLILHTRNRTKIIWIYLFYPMIVVKGMNYCPTKVLILVGHRWCI